MAQSRLGNWQSRLAVVMDKYRLQKDLVWGQFDCLTFSCEVYEAQTGKNYIEDFDFGYTTEFGALKRMKKAGYLSLEDAVTSNLGSPVNKNFASMGDICSMPSLTPFGGEDLALGVCVGTMCAGFGKNGIGYAKMSEVVNVWKVV